MGGQGGERKGIGRPRRREERHWEAKEKEERHWEAKKEEGKALGAKEDKGKALGAKAMVRKGGQGSKLIGEDRMRI